jgi:hypothetical protein
MKLKQKVAEWLGIKELAQQITAQAVKLSELEVELENTQKKLANARADLERIRIDVKPVPKPDSWSLEGFLRN